MWCLLPGSLSVCSLLFSDRQEASLVLTGSLAVFAVCVCRKQDDEQGRLIDQVTSETSGVVEGLRMKQQSVRQKEGQAQQLRGQVPTNLPQA